MLLQAASPRDLAGETAGRPIVLPRITPSCGGPGSGDDIVVCGARSDRFRLPLPVERSDDAPVKGELATPLAVITPRADCGLFAGQRTCNKREAARYGYGQGRDPATLLGRLARKLADSDTELGAVAEVP